MKISAADDRATRGAKRARVLAEAAKALNSRGVSQTSLSEIASRVGVSRAALYYYFEDQEDLVFQSYRRSCEIMARRLSEASHPAGDAIGVIDRFIDGMLAEGETEIAALSEIAFLRPEQRSTILGLYEGIMASIAEILDGGIRRGEVRPCAAGIVAPAIVGIISWIPMARRWRTSDPLAHLQMAKAIKSLLHRGMAADRAAASTYRPYDLKVAEVPVGRVFDQEALAAAKQEALLASASWLFNLKGVDATSLEEVALRVGVTKKVIYHNVGDKESLVIACYRRAFRFYEDIGARNHRYAGSRIDALCASTHALAEAGLREDITPLAPLAGFDALPDAVRQEINTCSTRLMDSYMKLLSDGVGEGTIRRFESRATLAVHPGTFERLPKWFETMDADERAAAPGELAQLTRLGLLPI